MTRQKLAKKPANAVAVTMNEPQKFLLGTNALHGRAFSFVLQLCGLIIRDDGKKPFLPSKTSRFDKCLPKSAQ